MQFRVRMQLAEALGPVNRWYCSQAHGRKTDEQEALLSYFIKSGGAKDFADRFEEAMGPVNRWYCSEFYGRDIRDQEILWDYYVTYGSDGSAEKNALQSTDNSLAALCIA